MLNDIADYMGNNLKENPYFGKLSSPSAYARIDGECGDDMMFFLIIENEIISEVKFYTEKGCNFTKTAGTCVAKMVKGKNIYDSLEISPMDILDNEEKLIENNREHCAILSLATFYNAISNFLLKKNE